MPPPRVLIALEPRMYAQVLAFSIERRRPSVEVHLLERPEELEAEIYRLEPQLVVANRRPPAGRGEAFFWVRVEEPVWPGTLGALGAEIRADGHSRSVVNLSTEDVLDALDLACGELPAEPTAEPTEGGGRT